MSSSVHYLYAATYKKVTKFSGIVRIDPLAPNYNNLVKEICGQHSTGTNVLRPERMTVDNLIKL